MEILDKCKVWVYGSRISLFQVWFWRFSSFESRLGETFPQPPFDLCPWSYPYFREGQFEETLCGNSNIASDIITPPRFWNFS